MNWLKLIQALVPVAVQVAEAIHPLSGSGKQKLGTAVTIVQTGLGLAAGAGVVSPEAAINAKAIVDAVNKHVSDLNNDGGVPALPSTNPK